jgi:Ca2+-binding EF-hand superfamily protein
MLTASTTSTQMAATVEDLKRQNDDLQAELARLQQLERLTEEDASYETKQQKLVGKVKEAFDSFDKDKSGYIDSAELAALANQLVLPPLSSATVL